MTTTHSINLTPYAGRVTTACKGADYVTNRAVAVSPGPVAFGPVGIMHRRKVRLCKAEAIPHLFYVAAKNIEAAVDTSTQCKCAVLEPEEAEND